MQGNGTIWWRNFVLRADIMAELGEVCNDIVRDGRRRGGGPHTRVQGV